MRLFWWFFFIYVYYEVFFFYVAGGNRNYSQPDADSIHFHPIVFQWLFFQNRVISSNLCADLYSIKDWVGPPLHISESLSLYSILLFLYSSLLILALFIALIFIPCFFNSVRALGSVCDPVCNVAWRIEEQL